MDGVVLSPCWLFGLEWPSPRVYRLFGRANGGFQEGLYQHASPRTAAPSAPVPIPGYCQSRPLRETLKHSQAGLAQSLVGSLLLFPGSWYTQGFACALQKSLFPSVLWKFRNQILLSLKISFPGYSQSLCLIPRLWSLMWGLESLQKCENFSDIFILQLVSHSPGGCGILFQPDYISPSILLWLLLWH